MKIPSVLGVLPFLTEIPLVSSQQSVPSDDINILEPNIAMNSLMNKVDSFLKGIDSNDIIETLNVHVGLRIPNDFPADINDINQALADINMDSLMDGIDDIFRNIDINGVISSLGIPTSAAVPTGFPTDIDGVNDILSAIDMDALANSVDDIFRNIDINSVISNLCVPAVADSQCNRNTKSNLLSLMLKSIERKSEGIPEQGATDYVVPTGGSDGMYVMPNRYNRPDDNYKYGVPSSSERVEVSTTDHDRRKDSSGSLVRGHLNGVLVATVAMALSVYLL